MDKDQCCKHEILVALYLYMCCHLLQPLSRKEHTVQYVSAFHHRIDDHTVEKVDI